MQESARGVILTETGLVLLMKVMGAAGELWITPGGRIRPGEDPAEAAVREVREETGWAAPVVRGLLWIRNGTFVAGGQRVSEREQFFLMPTERFEPTTDGMEPGELKRHAGFRWWRIPEIASSRETFAPRRLAQLLADLQQCGPPLDPVEADE
jgi:8-oxo-dGTP pyrophosphatase MutT (NUDIX family)